MAPDGEGEAEDMEAEAETRVWPPDIYAPHIRRSGISRRRSISPSGYLLELTRALVKAVFVETGESWSRWLMGVGLSVAVCGVWGRTEVRGQKVTTAAQEEP